MSKDPKDFGDVPKANPKFKPPAEFPKDKNALLAQVAAKGGFPTRAARWMAPREVRALLTGDYPRESSTILAVRTPRQIKSLDDFLTLAADRRVAYTQELKEREAAKKAKTQPAAKPAPKTKAKPTEEKAATAEA
jgi:hypothetical protein